MISITKKTVASIRSISRENFIFCKGFNNPCCSHRFHRCLSPGLSSLVNRRSLYELLPTRGKKLNKNNDIARKKEGSGRVQAVAITFIPRGGLVNITGDARRRGRPDISWQILGHEMFPTPSPGSVSTARYAIYRRTNRVDSYKRSRWGGGGIEGLCDEFTSTLRRILGISALLIKGLRYTSRYYGNEYFEYFAR